MAIRQLRSKLRNAEADALPGDLPCEAGLSPPETLATGFRSYHRFWVTLHDPNRAELTFDRELLRSGAVVGVLPVDFSRGQIVLTRQFRLGGHLALNRGEMLEIVAGRIDQGEQPEDAARRECCEEIGISPISLVRLLEFCPAPALSDEVMTLFLAHVDARRVPSAAGLAHENEEIAVICCPIAEAIELAESGKFHSGPTILALQWLGRNWARA